jgi:UDP-N-acetylmuramoyl-L-alanyl-D-glutamate--2,6-diaminopimelate ligase
MTTSDIVDFLRKSKQLLSTDIVKDNIIEGISDDSRKVDKNYIFVAIKGIRSDGNSFINEAIERGASLIIFDKEGQDHEKNTKKFSNTEVSFIKVHDSRKALSLLASFWFGSPAKKLKVIGVTGTKGKTTVVHLIYHIMKGLGYRVGMVSTVKAIVGKSIYDTGLHTTNPEPLYLQRLFKEMVDKSLEYAVVEVTSHGIDQERVFGVTFCVGVLTNISREHLDYHKTFSSYREIKSRLLLNSKKVVLNFDDPSYRYLVGKCRSKMRISYSLENDSDIRAQVIKISDEFMDYSVFYEDSSFRGRIKLVGNYNLSNILAAISAVKLIGINVSDAIQTLSNFTPPEGRLERVDNKKGINIFIDFAHTPDSLKNLLLLLNEIKMKGKLICIYGCAGERDEKKRFEMGRISGDLADISVITAEDPRSEKVTDIIRQISKGVKTSGALEYKGIILNNHNQFICIPDRNEAIYYSINHLAREGDTVVVCGKGHEKSMCYGDIEHPWSDRLSIFEALSNSRRNFAVIMGAGRGKRLNSDIPKVIQQIAGKPMISYTINNLRIAGFSDICVVVSKRFNAVKREIGPTLTYAIQSTPLGTGHAAWQGIKTLKGGGDPILVVNGDDSSFYKPKTYSDMYTSHKKSGAVLTFVTARVTNPFGMGRIIRDKGGKIVKILEENELRHEQKIIDEVNLGMYIFDPEWFLNNFKKVKKSESNEYYIVNLVEIALRNKSKVNAFKLEDLNEWQGVNTDEQLKAADRKMRDLLLRK